MTSPDKVSVPAKGLVLIFAAAVAACGAKSRAGPIVDPGFSTRQETRLEVYETGGFAGMVTDWVVVKETGAFDFSRRRPCASASCPPALDSASGTLTHAVADSLFAAAARDTVGLSAADFGATAGGADMVNYVVRLGTNGSVKTDARGDDGTMSPAMCRIVDAVHAAITAARK